MIYAYIIIVNKNHLLFQYISENYGNKTFKYGTVRGK